MGNTGNVDRIFCFDALTGDTLWSHSYASPLSPNSYEGGPSATPTVSDGRVYTLSKNGIAYCLDANDGGVLWEKNLAVTYGMRAATWGFAGSAYIHDDLVIYNAGTHGLGLRSADGTVAWQTGTSRCGYSTPVPFDFEEERYLILMGETTFAAVRADNGAVLWEKPWVTRYNANIPDPVVEGNLVFVSTGYQEGSALFDATTGQASQVWFQGGMQTWLNSSVLWGGYLYGPNDNGDAITCVRLSTGNVIWSEGGFGNGSLMLADGMLIILSQSGYLSIAEASSAGYREKGKGRILSGKCWSVPVLANGRIYARNAAGTVVCVELKTTAPKVDAGMSCVTWLKEGRTTVNLSGIVEDDTEDVTGVLWSVIQPTRGSTVEIADNEAASTTADFVNTGVYVLQLYAVDSEGQEGSDRVVVRVYGDSCEAAAKSPAGGGSGLYDFDSDCIETFSDFAVFAGQRLEAGDFRDLAVFADEWLEDKSLAGDVLYDAGRVSLPVE
jgi:outer membrane protein assembly factor BamB